MKVIKNLHSNVGIEAKTVKLLVEKINPLTFTDPDKSVIAKFKSPQANKILKHMVNERLSNYDAGSLSIDQVRKLNQQY